MGSDFPGASWSSGWIYSPRCWSGRHQAEEALQYGEGDVPAAPPDPRKSRTPVHVMPREILAAHELLSEVEQGLPRVAHLPALIVWGDRDRAFKERQRLRWERTFPNHKTVILPSASHYIQEDAPEETVAAIRDWWPGGSLGGGPRGSRQACS